MDQNEKNDFLTILAKLISGLFSNNKGLSASFSIPIPEIMPEAPKVEVEVPNEALDWNNLDSKVSKYFTVRECLWLPSWKRVANELDGLNDEVRENLVKLCKVMDQVREFLGQPIIVHCMYRPGPYSVQVGGSSTDVHTKGMAIDFHCPNISCDDVKAKLLPKLEEFGLRMENNGKCAGWVHLDIHPVMNARYFNA